MSVFMSKLQVLTIVVLTIVLDHRPSFPRHHEAGDIRPL
jgi:hypothetical protein